MKKIIALLALVGSTIGAHAAGTLGFAMVPRAGSIGSGESVIIDMYTDRSGVTGSSSYYLARFKFDIIGHAQGTLSGLVDTTPNWGFEHAVNNGTPSGANLLDIGGGRLPPRFDSPLYDTLEYLGSVTFTDGGEATENYTVTLSIVDYVSPQGSLNVFIGVSGTQSRSSYTSSTGTNHLVHFDIGSFEVIVPAPASLALLGLGGLVLGRRRR